MGWRSSGRWLPVLITATGLALSVAAARYQARDNRQVLEHRLERILDVAAEGIGTRLHNYRNVLRGMRGLLLVSGVDQLGQRELARYIANIDVAHEFPGARGFGFVRRVARENEAGYFERQRRAHGGVFKLREFGPHQEDRFVIQLIEPIDGNHAALGLDIGSEPTRRRAALAAMRSGAGQLTAPITLVQAAGGKGQAFLLLLPVYDEGIIPQPERRAAHLLGWTYTPLQVDAILHDLIGRGEHVVLGLEDVTDRVPVTVLTVPKGDAVTVQARTEREIFGRRWRLTLGGGDAFAAQQQLTHPATVLAIGLAATAALTTLALLAAAGRRRRVEIRAGQTRLAAIVDSSIDAIVGKGLDGRILSWNRGAVAMFGYTAEEAIGRTVFDLLVPPELHAEEDAVLARLARGAVVDLETRRRHKDGHGIDVWMSMTPVLGGHGRVESVATTVRDITERKAAAERVRADNVRLEEMVARRTAQLEQLNALLSGVLDAATGVAIVAMAPDGTITVFNRGAELMLGYHADDVIGRDMWMTFHDAEEVRERAAEIGVADEGMAAGLRTFLLYAERDGSETREWTYLRRDGQRIAVSLTVSAIRDGQGSINGYLGVALDITTRKELLDSMRRAKEEADAASEAKSTFLANMSHEIRTPMNAVLGMLHLIRMTRLDTRQLDYVRKAEQAAHSLLQLLNDVLDYSKMEAGKLKPDPHPFELDGLMRDLAVILSGNQGGKAVEVLFDMDPRLPASLVGDRLRLQQVLINLAGNALKFTERGTVKVSLEVLGREGAQVTVRFAVEDTGIGIDLDQRERIFDGFTQAEGSISRRFGGTGLGLVICRRLVALMGGTLELDSTLGVGSRFWFDLVLQEAASLPRATQRALRVLVVDDHADAAEAMLRMAEGLGWNAVLAGGGREALERVRAADVPYDVVLLDWRMPDIDGLEAARMMRGACAPAPVVVMVTASGRDVLLAEHGSHLSAPFADVLTKPVTPGLLHEAVTRALAGEPLEQAELAPRRVRLEGMRILLVEDNALNRQVARELLESEGAQVDVAENGREGLEHLLAARCLPDAVLMDMQMPVMDGLEATRRIRAALGASLPIIAMTANASAADRARCLAAGMDEHLGKPIDLEALVRVLEPGRSAPVGPAGDAGSAHEEDLEPARTVLARFGDNTAIYLHSLDTFESDTLALAAQAREALVRGDAREAVAAVHAIKGAAATIGARALAGRMDELERRLKSGAMEVAWLSCLSTAAAPEALHAVAAQLRAAVRPFLGQAVAVARAPDMAGLAALLDSGNLRALEIAEQLAAHAVPGSPQARLAEQINMLDFAAARATLAQLEAADSGARA